MSNDTLDPEVAEYYACLNDVHHYRVLEHICLSTTYILFAISFSLFMIGHLTAAAGAGIFSLVFYSGAIFLKGSRNYEYGGNHAWFFGRVCRWFDIDCEVYPDLNEWYESLKGRGKIPEPQVEGYIND